MKKIFVFAFSIIVLVICSGFTIPEELLLDGTAFQSAEYIRNNLDIINEYAVDNGYNGNRTATYIQPILIFNGETYENGYFVDFNDYNGGANGNTWLGSFIVEV